jgi:hypothetical protein
LWPTDFCAVKTTYSRIKKLLKKDCLIAPDPPPFVYSFSVRAWSLRRETRDEVTKRVMKEVARRLREYLVSHERLAGKMGLVKNPRIIGDMRHFQWLALYQVRGWRIAKIARHVAKTWPARGTDVKHLAQTISSGIQKAAKLVVGPAVKAWLRPTRRGASTKDERRDSDS